MTDYINKIEQSFLGTSYQIKDAIEFLNTYTNDIDRYIEILEFNKDELHYQLDELDIRLRALRDKLNERNN